MQCLHCGHDNPPDAAQCVACGADLAQDDSISPGDSSAEGHDDATPAERAIAKDIASLLKEGKKVEAVKRYRQATGTDLVDAVAAIDKIQEKHGIKSKGCIGGVLSLLMLAVLLSGLGGLRASGADEPAGPKAKPADAPLRIHVLSGSKEYRSEASLRSFIERLDTTYRVECTASWASDGATHIEGIDDLAKAELLVVFARRLKLPEEEMAVVRKHWESGKPVLGIRTAGHAFQKEDNAVFDRKVLGGNYTGYGQSKPFRATVVAAQAEHPVLKDVGEITSDKMYHAGPLAEGVVVLHIGDDGEKRHPVTFVSEYEGGRTFFTSMGIPQDFESEHFRRMLLNAVFWTTRRDPEAMARGAGTSRLPGGTSGAGRSSRFDDAAAAERAGLQGVHSRQPSLAGQAEARARGPFRQNGPTQRQPVVLTERARAIHRDAPVFDGHNDLPWQLRNHAGSSFDAADIAKSVEQFHTDIPRLKKGGVGAQFFAAYVPADERHQNKAAHFALEQIDIIRRMCRRYPDAFELAVTADDVERIRKEGKIAALIGIEGGHAIENSLAVLRMFADLGVRYMTLTHSDTLDWADSATDEPKHKGLTPFGEDVIRTMNELGMLADISHVSADTMRHVLRVSKAPVIASHSSAYAIAPHPRNVPDDVLKLVAKNGGVVMVNFYSGFVVPESAKKRANVLEVMRELRKQHKTPAEFDKAFAAWQEEHPIEAGDIHHVVDHIEHIAKVAGIDHVGLGSDYDGITLTPAQLEDVSTFPYITQALLDRGYDEEAIRKILGGNILRALREAEKTAREMEK
ncbi:MAG: membrane dipeptidase [Planctomycetaceae bacterium]